MRGGYLEKCDPGISDLDFSLEVEKDTNVFEFISLYRKYRRLKSIFRIPGEMNVTTQSYWETMVRLAPASVFLHEGRRRYSQGHWIADTAFQGHRVRKKSRLTFSANYYALGWNSLLLSRWNPGSFYWISSQKYFKKCLKFSSLSTLPSGFRDAEELIALAFFALQTLAEESYSARSWEKIGVLKAGQLNPLSLLSLARLEWINESTDLNLSPGPIPFIYLCPPNQSAEEVRRQVRSLFQFAKLNPKFSFLVVTPAIYFSFIRDRLWAPVLDNAKWIDLETLDSELIREIYEGVCERSVSSLNSILGCPFSYRDYLNLRLSEFCRECLIAASGEQGVLGNYSRSELTQTGKIYKTLEPNERPLIRKWFEMTLRVTEEFQESLGGLVG